jgi:DNA replication protein DnaC
MRRLGKRAAHPVLYLSDRCIKANKNAHFRLFSLDFVAFSRENLSIRGEMPTLRRISKNLMPMKVYQTNEIKNLAFVGSSGSGKPRS